MSHFLDMQLHLTRPCQDVLTFCSVHPILRAAYESTFVCFW